ncbi:MAG: hypothetical protein II670_11960 [Alphaproteobacteria bacterium]|jgi:hypothetical protein|nr:hypothetical protein [Alphaproteobacteria bacterium]
MAIKKKLNFNVDKKRQCYNQPEGLFEELSQHPKDKYLNYEYFTLHIIDDGRVENSDKQPIKIKANVILSDGTLLGEFEFHNSAQYDGRCFFSFANSALYKMTSNMHGQKYNHQSDLQYITDVLGLELNNYTKIELAADVNFNVIAKIQKLIKDYQHYDMIVNGRRITDENRTIEGFGEYFGRSRAKRNKYPTLYFTQAKNDGLELKIYDKSREILEENPHKQYIVDWNDFGEQKIYRLELTIKNEQYKKWLEYVRSGEGGLLRDWGFFEASEGLLMLDAYKCPLWQFGADRVVYWRNRATNQVVSLLDVARGVAS